MQLKFYRFSNYRNRILSKRKRLKTRKNKSNIINVCANGQCGCN